MTDIQTLHILNKSPDHPRAIRCFEVLAEKDSLLLTENGVLLLATGNLAGVSRVFALAPDAKARGLGHRECNVAYVDFPEMVALSLQAQRVISW